MKIRLHPLFFAATFLYLLVGGLLSYLVAFLAVTLHELSHYAIARLAGAEELSITLMPYGATMRSEGEIPHFGAVLAAGPLANLILASLGLSACWIFPELYGYTKSFIAANVLLAIANLLPAYPLDGGRLLRLLFPMKAIRVITALFTLLAALAAGALFALFRNLSYLTFSLFMLSYFFAFCIGRVNRCRVSDPLYALAKTDEEGRLLPAIVRKGKHTLARLSPLEITRLCLTYSRETEIGEALALSKVGYK